MGSNIHETHDENYAALPWALRQEVYDFLHHEFPQSFFDQIRLGYLIYGKEWWRQEEDIFNMKEGDTVRKALRHNGYSDYDLPCGNWDDVYIPVLEAAAGVRPVLFPDEDH